jgi:hypothetical protein
MCFDNAKAIQLIFRLFRQNGIPRDLESRKIPHLNLQHGQVTENLQVFGIDFQGLFVGFNGLEVITVRAVQQTVYVPTNV